MRRGTPVRTAAPGTAAPGDPRGIPAQRGRTLDAERPAGIRLHPDVRRGLARIFGPGLFLPRPTPQPAILRRSPHGASHAYGADSGMQPPLPVLAAQTQPGLAFDEGNAVLSVATSTSSRPRAGSVMPNSMSMSMNTA